VTTLVAFLLVAVVVIVTPGPDTALTIKNSLAGGRRGGLATAFGVSSGQAVWAVAASAGLAAVIVASEPVFRALQLLGGAYLVYLGAHALYRAVTRRAPCAVESERSGLSRRAAFRQGVLSNLANPKMAVFFTGLLPSFAGSGGDPAFASMLGLGLLFCLLTLAWLAGYALAVDRAAGILMRPRVRRLLDAVTGLALVALGLRVATERR